MNWFYALHNERRGPVADTEIASLLRNGTLTSATLVWRDGMENWLPLSAVGQQFNLGVRVAAASPAGTLERCAECGLGFPRGDMIEFEKSWVCASCKPVFFQKLREGVPTGGATGVWRRKRQLVVALDAVLPDRCVKCNCDVGGARFKRVLYWHHPALYLMILFPSLLIYAIVALAVRKRAILMIGLCPEHRSQRTRAILIAWLLAVLGGCGAFVGIMDEKGALAVAGFASLLIAMILGAVRGPVVQAKRIEHGQAHLSGVCRKYLEELPEWTRM